ncbi:hypothetical protein D3C81_493290 [compost metagenome]
MQAHLTEVRRCLIPVLSALALLPEEQTASGAQPPQPEAELSDRLTRLGQLLAESDTAAFEALDELRRLSLGDALARRLSRVAQQLERFDFDRALALLQGEIERSALPPE